MKKTFVAALASIVVIFGASPAFAMQTSSSADTKGIDVSHWNGTINWSQVAQSGVQFAYSKASDGTSYVDPTFAANVQGAHAAGIVIGGYHYARPTTSTSDAVSEADNFANVLNANKTDLIPVLDLETPTDGSMTSDQIVAWVNAFNNQLYAKTGDHDMLYAGQWFMDMYNGFSGLLASMPLWDAFNPAQNGGATSPYNDGGWTSWKVWQYDVQASVPGVIGYCDVDYGPTSLADIETTAVASTATQYVVVKHNAYIISAPKLRSTKIALERKGTKLTKLSGGNRYWWHVRDSHGRTGYITTNRYYTSS